MGEIDSGNGLYPFMVAACGSTRGLGGVYCLLRRNPSLVSHGIGIEMMDHSVGDRQKRTSGTEKRSTTKKHK